MITDLSKRAPLANPEPSLRATLALGFRPFFLLAGVFGAGAVALWLLAVERVVTLPTSLPPSAWHGHEMVYGFVVAVVAGFLLTAVGNWTGQSMPSGGRLGGLAAVWIAGRVAVSFSGVMPTWLAASVDLAFVPALAWTIGRPIVVSKNRRNLGLLVPLAVLLVANALFHFGPQGVASRALRVAIDAVLLLIVVIGGRVIPSFTAGALRVTIAPRRWLDWASLGSVAIVAVLDAALGASPWTGGAAIAAGALNGLRLLGWRPFETRGAPILWVLHLAYAWLALGLVLSGVCAFEPTWLATAPLHALTVGAIALLILGMMSRVGLGHTGRMLTVSRATVVAYVLLASAALVRAVGPLLFPSEYRAEILVSGVLWISAFVLFLVAYARVLSTPRVDGKPG